MKYILHSKQFLSRKYQELINWYYDVVEKLKLFSGNRMYEVRSCIDNNY